MKYSKLLLGATLITSTFYSISVAKKPKKVEKKPNIIFILCDDLGYGDLGCYGQKYIHTPNIDSLASRGIKFTDAYAGSPVSAPSRASLMTGQHCGHTHVRGNKEYWPNSSKTKYGVNEEYNITGQEPYDSNHIILPEIMKHNGYTTGMFGKWAGGYEGSMSTPDKRGVDDFYGYICQFQAHQYFPNFLNKFSKEDGDTAVVREILDSNIIFNMNNEEYFKRPQYSADIIHKKAMQWLSKQTADKPFYGLFTYTLPHAELAQPNDSILKYYKSKFFNDKTWGGEINSRYHESVHTHAQFAAMITRLDTYVGQIIEELKKKGLENNTIIIFSSDNGPHEEGGADPHFFGRDGKLRGLKRQCYEGGIRVPFIVAWPGHIKPHQVCNTPIAFWDIMPTFCDIIGDKNFPTAYLNPKDSLDVFDGISFYPTLINMPQKQKLHKYLYWEFHETNQIAVRKGDWKLLVIKGVPKLYNLANDIHEDNDVAKDNPEIVKELIDIIYYEHRDNPMFKITLPQQKN